MRKFNADLLGERLVRKLAGHTSRRGMLSKIGLALAAAPVFPVLPISRAQAQGKRDRGAAAHTHFYMNAQTKDDTKCDYWRYCGVDGNLCACCGGGPHTCPAGATASTTSWVGTCVNPDDSKTYLIAYRDCCGKPNCGQCHCDNEDRDTQLYVPQTNNDIIWCFGLDNMQYHCSTAALVGAVQ